MSQSKMYGSLQSPNFPEPYPRETQLHWNISVPEGFRIKLYFSHFDLEPSYLCNYDYVKVSWQGIMGNFSFFSYILIILYIPKFAVIWIKLYGQFYNDNLQICDKLFVINFLHVKFKFLWFKPILVWLLPHTHINQQSALCLGCLLSEESYQDDAVEWHHLNTN